MADYPVSAPQASSPPVSAGLVVYVLFAIAAVSAVVAHGLFVFAPLVGAAGIVGVIIAYVKRGDAAGTWVESHFTWLIRTFWWSLLWGMFGGLVLVTLGWILIGIPIAFGIFFVTSIWGLYRVVRGILHFKDDQPIPA
jgi:uncharacterized membrane protein